MPKKFKGENTKATSARERKAAKAAEEKEAHARRVEDLTWQDDDKHLANKNKRKEEKEKKQQEANQRRLENQKLLEEEEKAINIKPKGTKPSQKVTQFQIQAQRQAAAAAASATTTCEEIETHLTVPLHENLNKQLALDEDGEPIEQISATGVDNVLSALGADSKPEPKGGRVKVNMAAAFLKFQEDRMPSVRKENPSVNRSKHLQIIKKEWTKSPENPLNQYS